MPQKPEPRPVHWRPILAAGVAGRTLGAMRPDDVVSRLRHPRRGRPAAPSCARQDPAGHLAMAAAVPLMVMLAIFVFERGFTVGVEMRQRAPSAPASMRSNSPEPAPSLASPPPTAAPAQSPRLPLFLRNRLPLRPRRRSPVSRASSGKSEGHGAEGTRDQGRRAPAVTECAKSRAMPGRTSPRPPAASEADPDQIRSGFSISRIRRMPTRKETPTKSPAVARPAPSTHDAATAAAAGPKRRGSVDVVGRLQVKNRSEAERELAALVAPYGGNIH